eukprot:403369437
MNRAQQKTPPTFDNYEGEISLNLQDKSTDLEGNKSQIISSNKINKTLQFSKSNIDLNRSSNISKNKEQNLAKKLITNKSNQSLSQIRHQIMYSRGKKSQSKSKNGQVIRNQKSVINRNSNLQYQSHQSTTYDESNASINYRSQIQSPSLFDILTPEKQSKKRFDLSSTKNQKQNNTVRSKVSNLLKNRLNQLNDRSKDKSCSNSYKNTQLNSERESPMKQSTPNPSNIHKDGCCQDRFVVKMLENNDKLCQYQRSHSRQNSSFLNTQQQTTADSTIKNSKSQRLLATHQKKDSNRLISKLEIYSDNSDDLDEKRDIKIMQKNHSAVNIISEPFNITIDVGNHIQNQVNQKSRNQTENILVDHQSNPVENMNERSFGQKYLYCGVWPEMSYMTQQSARKQIRLKSQNTRDNFLNFKENSKSMRTDRKGIAEDESCSDTSKLIIHKVDQHNFSFDISRNDNIFSVDAKVQFQTQEEGDQDLLEQQTPVLSLVQQVDNTAATCIPQQKKDNTFHSSECQCCEKLRQEQLQHKQTQMALDSALQLAQLLMQEVQLLDKNQRNTMLSDQDDQNADTQIPQQKDKDFDAIDPRINFTDMTEERKNLCIEICREAYKMQHDGELKYFKDMALHIKHEMEKKQLGSWHIIVGTNFGSFVTYEHKAVILFFLEHIGFLMFKHG